MAATIVLSFAHAQQASTTEWNADPETPGDWKDASWTGGAPAAGSLVAFSTGGTVSSPAMGRENSMLTSKRNGNQTKDENL